MVHHRVLRGCRHRQGGWRRNRLATQASRDRRGMCSRRHHRNSSRRGRSSGDDSKGRRGGDNSRRRSGGDNSRGRSGGDDSRGRSGGDSRRGGDSSRRGGDSRRCRSDSRIGHRSCSGNSCPHLFQFTVDSVELDLDVPPSLLLFNGLLLLVAHGPLEHLEHGCEVGCVTLFLPVCFLPQVFNSCATIFFFLAGGHQPASVFQPPVRHFYYALGLV